MGPATIALKHGEAALTAIPKFHKFAFVLFVRNETPARDVICHRDRSGCEAMG